MRRSGSPAPKGGSPVPSSYRTAPSAYRSARWSTARPVRPVCSGARYASVPGISLWCVNSGRISAIDVARAKSTRVGVPSAATTTLAGVRSRWITSRRCTSAKARAIPRANRARSRAGSGFGRSARVRSPASVRTIEPSCGGSSASCATPTAPRKRSSTANSCRSRRPASGPSGSFTISARSGRDSRVTRVRALSCTTANRTGGSTPSAIPHLHAGSQTRSPGPPPSLRLPTDEGDRRRATLSLPESRPWRSPAITPANRLLQPRADLNMRVESQGAERRADSVQAFMSTHLQSAHAFDVLLDDDRAGEAADLVGITVVGAELHVTLVHCKYSARETAGARLGDLYELCGQAVRGAKWRQQGAQPLLYRLDRRAQRYRELFGRSPYEVGDINRLYRIREQAPTLRPRFHTILAQPGLSATAATDEHLRLFAGAEAYVRAVTRGTFEVYCSP